MKKSSSTAVTAKSIYFAALDIANPVERSKYVGQACEGDDSLRAEVEQLISASQSDRTNLFSRAVRQMNPQATDESPHDAESLAATCAFIDPSGHPIIDRYKLLEEIGRGGMGTVYLAQQLEPVKRRVALKVINPGMDSREVIARFEAERQALAMMDHPHIARVFDGGTTETGRPYFVMELVRGVPITEYCDKHELPLDDRLQLFIDVAKRSSTPIRRASSTATSNPRTYKSPTTTASRS